MGVFFRVAPGDDEVRALLRARAEAPFTHAHAGLTKTPLSAAPAGFHLDRYGAPLGRGRAVFERAAAALARFENYPPSFTRVVRGEGALGPGLLFATVVSHMGFASVHPCRVLDVIADEDRFGFAFGTLPGHAESGEECFLVVIADDEVRYEVQAFSRPQALLARLGAPITRRYQVRFQRETLAAMQRASR